MSRPLRWTEQAVAQLGVIGEHIAVRSPVYAEQVVDRVVRWLERLSLKLAALAIVASLAAEH